MRKTEFQLNFFTQLSFIVLHDLVGRVVNLHNIPMIIAEGMHNIAHGIHTGHVIMAPMTMITKTKNNASPIQLKTAK